MEVNAPTVRKNRSGSESQTTLGRFYKYRVKLLVIDVLMSLVRSSQRCLIIYCVGALPRKLASFLSVISSLFLIRILR